MAMIGPIAGTGARLAPAIPPGFGAVMKWLSQQGDGVSCPWCGGHEGADAPRGSSRGRSGASRASLVRATAPKRKKRSVSPYQREFGRQLKKLKKAHPRTPVTKLMKRAHTATRKARR